MRWMGGGLGGQDRGGQMHRKTVNGGMIGQANGQQTEDGWTDE